MTRLACSLLVGALGLGGLVISGNETASGISGTAPVLIHPWEFLGLEFRPAWAGVNDNVVQDYDLSLLAGWRFVSVRAGYRWTILDDAHFRAAAIPEEDLWGPYTTEDQGHLLRVFGTEQGLRYRIPFRDVDEVIDYLRDHATEAGDRVGMMGDDGEKFGAWPTTWEHCWGERRWVERFFEAIEANGDWLTTTTPSAWLAEHPPIGRVYVPTGSYSEMGEWALPADESLVFSEILHRAQAEHRPEARWLRGAFWRNFQVKYREINDLHKRMLRVSSAVHAMRVATGQADEPDAGGDDGKSRAAVELGSRGGKARAKKLGVRRRKAIAKAAADARWKRTKN